MKWGLLATKYVDFNRWVPPPLNLPPMTDEEKNKAASKRLENPPLCECGDPAVVDDSLVSA
jgi:hypothetical protein